MSKDKILVTGGAGFIGSNFIGYMLRKYCKYQIINLDKLTYAGNLDNLKDIEDNLNYSFIKGNINNRKLVSRIMPDIKYLINFAAESHVDRSIEEGRVFIRTNVLGTQTLLDIGQEYGLERFIQISTDEVYGSLGKTGFFTENSPLLPSSPYSASKASADLLARSYYKTYGLPVIITRCSNNYGPYQNREKFIPLMIINALQDNKLPIYGDGLQVRDWIHVLDHCRAIDRILHQGQPGEIYNIGSNNEWTNLELVKMILKIMGKSEELITHVKDRPGHDRRYAIDASKIYHELDWQPEYDFEEGLHQTIDWYLSNREWWE